jgi:3-methyladenine DNA glycosylase AlkD
MTRKAALPADTARTRAPRPRALAAASRRCLLGAADSRVAAGLQAYFKDGDRVAFYGLKTPALRAIERELFACVDGSWRLEEGVAYCALMLEQPQLEAKGLGLLLLARFKRQFGSGLLATAKRWLSAGHCANWATTDALCSLVIAEVLRRFPGCIGTLPAWTQSRHLWVRRAAAVSLTSFARRGQALDEAYCVVSSLLGDREDLIHKACGWLLREAGKTDAARLERFLLDNGARVPRTTLRYAIERLPPPRRKQLLARTRA